MALYGNLENVSLESILQMLCNETKTGVLRVKRDDTEYQVYFLNGAIVYAIESRKESQLGHLLVKDDQITPQDLEQSLEQSMKKKQALGRTLVDNGLITSETLEEYIYLQAREIFTIMFRKDEGIFEYRDTNYSLKWLVVVELSTMQLIMDALRERDESECQEAAAV